MSSERNTRKRLEDTRAKRCEYNNKNEDNTSKTLNDKKKQQKKTYNTVYKMNLHQKIRHIYALY